MQKNPILCLFGISLALLLSACGGSNSNANANKQNTPPTLNKPNNDWSNNTDFANCSEQIYQQPPTVAINMVKDSYPLCFNGFAVLYSGVSRTPIWVGEYLTRQRLSYAKKLKREDNFHAESRLPSSVRSEIYDYKKSGYDRGHLAPNADMSNKTSQYDSFSLANIAPQHPDNNQKNWLKVEQLTRTLTNRYGSSYVITGVAYLSPQLKKLNNRVLVPTHFFKAVYFPSNNQAVAFITPNDASQQTDVVSLQQLQQVTGVDAFPNLPYTVKNVKMAINF
ncbi:DNA/RNA non-specific endonuclease (Mg-dependent) [Moraxella macacae 0408225]|uniref:Endonuclease n=1 Tax=Moraxella macacae 0408225 TaxID=1230338 RepID=L2F703_9GAMM|nr:DNA/RNA non-specific endonuclease [Moraxella macacae]ELA08675.1 DNA/RNA non-specific endonuclease (Mg-dependent) [Moraxella macacae 0408225]